MWSKEIEDYDDTPAEVAPDVIECAVDGPPEDAGIGFGLPKLDRKLRGFRRNDFIVVAAPAGTGKTPFVLDGMRRRGVHLGCGHQMYFTFEMQKEDVLRELVSQESKVALDILLSGAQEQDKPEIYELVQNAIERINPVFSIVDGCVGKTTMEFIFEMIVHKKEQLEARGEKLDLVAIDYLQLLAEGHEEITRWTRGIKAFCIRHQVPIIAISSLNNKYDERVENAIRPRYTKPGMSLPRYVTATYSDLRGSGNIQYDASKIIFLLHDYDDGTQNVPNRWVQIKKNKFGLAGGISEVQINRCLSFEEGHA